MTKVGRGLIRFDLSSLSDKNISSAKLALKPITAGPDAGTDNLVYPVTKSWDVNTVVWDTSGGTWDNQGGMSSEQDMYYYKGGGDFNESDGVTEAQEGDWETYDVTSFIKEMVAGTRDNNGFLFRGGPGLGMFMDGIDYASSEASNQDDRPKLIVEFDGTPILGNKTVRADLMRISSAAGALTINITNAGSFNVTLANTQGRIVHTTSLEGGRDVTIPTGALSSGVYFLNVAGNGVMHSERVMIK